MILQFGLPELSLKEKIICVLILWISLQLEKVFEILHVQTPISWPKTTDQVHSPGPQASISKDPSSNAHPLVSNHFKI